MASQELKAALEFILNGANDAEFEVLVKAVQRRQRDRHLFSGMGGLNPNQSAKAMAGQLQERVGSLDSVKAMTRDFVAQLIRKEAPEIPEADLAALLDSYTHRIEDGQAAKAPAKPDNPQLVLSMLRNFVSYSLGSMPASEQAGLWESMPRWQEEYWKAFSPEIKAFTEALLEGRLGIEDYWSVVYSLLGL